MEERTHPPEALTIRVYGIMLDEDKGVLITDEFENTSLPEWVGKRFSKFPGGGLELGEGIHDCLLREWREELGQTILITQHFYTTDFYQVSAFDAKKQVISIYYLVKPLSQAQVRISDTPFVFEEEKEGEQSFRWIAMKDFSEDIMTFPIDKLVAKMIIESRK